jgi:2-keto-3-deoxy-L-rhamnonate aldolase RhmA
MKTDIRTRLRRGDTLLGSWLQLPSERTARLVAGQGFDWVAVDCEHGPNDLERVAGMLCEIRSAGAAGFVRVPAAESIWIRRAMDAGADGLIVPMVQDEVQAARIVEYAKYPPLGKRGFGFCLANEFGGMFDDYARAANETHVLIAQIEHIEAVGAASRILDVEGIDGVMIGPYDLAGSMGLVGQPGHPDVLAAADRVLEACRTKGKAAGYHVVAADPAAALPFLARGYRFVALGVDSLFIRDGAARVLEAARAARPGGSPATRDPRDAGREAAAGAPSVERD